MSLQAKRLEGKTAVITRGNHGIGYATAQVFVNHGAKVVIHHRTEPGETQRSCRETQGKDSAHMPGVLADVRSLEQLSALAETTSKLFDGHLDVLFVNWGVVGMGFNIEKADEAEFDFIIDVNIKGLFFTILKLARPS